MSISDARKNRTGSPSGPPPRARGLMLNMRIRAIRPQSTLVTLRRRMPGRRDRQLRCESLYRGSVIPAFSSLLVPWVAALIAPHMVEGCRMIDNLRRLYARGPDPSGAVCRCGWRHAWAGCAPARREQVAEPAARPEPAGIKLATLPDFPWIGAQRFDPNCRQPRRPARSARSRRIAAGTLVYRPRDHGTRDCADLPKKLELHRPARGACRTRRLHYGSGRRRADRGRAQ